MSRIWQYLLGIEPRSPGAVPAGESTRLELTGLPGGGMALALVAAVVAVLVLLWWLPRREKQELSGPRRAWLVVLRALVLLAIAVMLLEPVLVSSHRETVRSHLPIIVDDSESMRFSDPYTDETRAAATAAALKLQGQGGKSPVDRLRETPRLDLAKGAISEQLDDLGKGRDVAFYDLESASKAVTAGPARAKPLEEIQPRRSDFPPRRRASGRPGGAPGPAGGGDRAGLRRPFERRRRPAPGGRVARPARHPDLPDRVRRRGGPAQRAGRRDRGQPGRLRR